MRSSGGVRDRPTLRLERVFDAPRALLWAAWTKPEMIVRWMGPVEWPAVSATSDFRVGGRWSTTLQSASDEQLLEMSGVYLEIEPERRLAFTFKWGAGHEDGTAVETVVTVVLSDMPGDRTRLNFVHADLKSEESVAGHRHGWTSTFSRLADWIARHQGSNHDEACH